MTTQDPGTRSSGAQVPAQGASQAPIPAQPAYAGYGTPLPPPKKSRKRLVIALAVGIPLVLIGLLVGVALLFLRVATGPADATNEFLAALQGGDRAAVEAVSCQEMVQAGAVAQLLDEIEALEAERGALSSYDITSSEVTDDTGTASGTVTWSDGLTTDVAASLVTEGGEWKVCGIGEP